MKKTMNEYIKELHEHLTIARSLLEDSELVDCIEENNPDCIYDTYNKIGELEDIVYNLIEE